MKNHTYDPDYTNWMREVYFTLLDLGVDDKQARKSAQDQRDLFNDNYIPKHVAEIVAANLEYGIEIGESQMS